jgi:hypothetical protein
MEKAFVEGNPKALQLSQELDKLIVEEQRAILKQGGYINVMVRPEQNADAQRII